MINWFQVDLLKVSKLSSKINFFVSGLTVVGALVVVAFAVVDVVVALVVEVVAGALVVVTLAACA